ncbi:bifunctional hydroxymethylpyrimidine kinase/phosphomethylpyrimidine kinase [Curvibacter sp. CHRR-16]|uniref:bifunctional hydroxymethylpyrimidine kinase/phosphomethylpyrimidine kinase n=1 Tax=Curvibacter sp. CHRR-16 TaxID=2835872 RepID=UPI001BDA267D|nr:bifunctional hydroxymethylpyrimidine kinase/phosphomethylpyrimidine kinase [Curvibacter sp. CHRR-16]MBT0569875.1 bifunctional hydroxymethylpyrimidine kinase/phosphomethylpyrimidine kinase [Curvibacter sp. CHRR-16]
MNDSPAPSPDTEAAGQSACVMCFNSNDPVGATGLAADLLTVASMGGHTLPVCAGTYVRDTAEIMAHYPLEDEAIGEQARLALEDIAVQMFKVGFVGSMDNISAIAELASDYADTPLLLYMPDLSWWQDDRIDQYQDACQELLLPLASVLVGSYNTLVRWLLPDWDASKPASPRDIARAADALGVPYTVLTGWSSDNQHLDILLCTPNATLTSQSVERLDSSFIGAGDTFSAALAALLATGSEIVEAVNEASAYLQQTLDGGFRLGMGHLLPDHLFWAQAETDEEDDDNGSLPLDIDMPPNATRH